MLVNRSQRLTFAALFAALLLAIVWGRYQTCSRSGKAASLWQCVQDFTQRSMDEVDQRTVLLPLFVVSPLNTDYEVSAYYHNATNWRSRGEDGDDALPRIAMVSHVTLDRWARLQAWCRRWRGPMSVAFFLRPGSENAELGALRAALEADRCLRTHADMHLTRERADGVSGVTSDNRSAHKDMMTYYPFNVQRNAATAGCRWELMLLVDIDMVLLPRPDSGNASPPLVGGKEPAGMALSMNDTIHNVDGNHKAVQGAESELRASLVENRGVFHSAMAQKRAQQGSTRLLAMRLELVKTLLEEKLKTEGVFFDESELNTVAERLLVPSIDSIVASAVWVIPAVESVHKNVSLPTTLAELQHAVDDHSVCDFYGHYCRSCHLPSDLRRFLRASSPYVVSYIEGYEPYVIVNKSSFALFDAQVQDVLGARRRSPRGPSALPQYDESFIGRGWDKMSFFYELAMQRRTFVVLPGWFLGHLGRGDMPAMMTSEYMRRQEVNRDLMAEFKQRMEATYRPVSSATHMHHSSSAATASAKPQLCGGEFGSQPCVVPLVTHPTLLKLRGAVGAELLDYFGSDVAAALEPIALDGRLWSCGVMWSSLASSVEIASRLSVQSTAEDITRNIRRRSSSCIVAKRPVHLLDRRYRHDVRLVAHETPYRDLEALAAAVRFVCERLPSACSPRSGGVGDSDDDGKRRGAIQSLEPPATNLVALADYVFDRWVQHAMTTLGEDESTACDFGGLASLRVTDKEGYPHRHREHGTFTRGRPHLSGCTLHPDFTRNSTTLNDLLREICSDVDLANSSASNDRVLLPSVLGVKACRQLFAAMHPALRHDVDAQCAAALNAHHLFFAAGGAGCTCGCRFGSERAILVVPSHR